jgi:hypothetical protein
VHIGSVWSVVILQKVGRDVHMAEARKWNIVTAVKNVSVA